MEDITQSDTRKRKRSPVDSLVNVPVPFSSNSLSQDVSGSPTSPTEDLPLPKRARLPKKPPAPDSGSASTSSMTSLPPGVLQAIFSNLDPPCLARLIRVSRTFRDLLDARCQLPPDEAVNVSHNGLRYRKNSSPLLSQDNVWRLSRRRYAPSMPQPAKDTPECELFALSFGITCQFCGVLPTPVSKSGDTWCPVPAEYSVRILWPFKVRSCMPCLASRLKKVILQLDSVMSSILTRSLGFRCDDVGRLPVAPCLIICLFHAIVAICAAVALARSYPPRRRSAEILLCS